MASVKIYNFIFIFIMVSFKKKKERSWLYNILHTLFLLYNTGVVHTYILYVATYTCIYVCNVYIYMQHICQM